MADENKIAAKAAADAPAKVAETVADTTAKVATESKQAAKRARAAGARRAKRQEKADKPARKATRRTATTARRSTKRSAAAKPAAAAVNGRINDVTFDFNTLFGGMPATQPFQNLFAEAGERSQEAARRSQKVAEELAELTRANVEAIVDAGRIAVEGARSIGQDVVASNRDGIEKTAEAVRSFAEAKSPTEFLQLQGEFARNSFDRMVAESSKLTESMVKLAGEAIQPLSNRASVNAERINQLVA